MSADLNPCRVSPALDEVISLRRRAAGRWNAIRLACGELARGNLHTPLSAARLAKRICTDPHGRYVVFLVGGTNGITGGWMSLFAIAGETEKLREIHGASVAICTALRAAPLRKYTKFDNNAQLIPFKTFLRTIPPAAKLLVHVPEVYAAQYIVQNIAFLQKQPVSWRFNILLQNIDMAPSSETVARLKTLGPVTATAAHASYATEETAHRLGCPVRHLLAWTSPTPYQWTSYKEKSKLVVISPDNHPAKAEIVKRILLALPDHQIVEIRGMTYREYRATILTAKFTYTFGEGLDAYFCETILCGGIGIAVYNDRFFTADFSGMPGVFSNQEAAASSLGTFLRETDNPESYARMAEQQFQRVTQHYSKDRHVESIRCLYSDFLRLPQ